MPMVRKLQYLGVTAALSLLAIQPLSAGDFRWSGTAAVADWFDGSNWTNGSAPGASDNAWFTDRAYQGTVNVTSNTEIAYFYMTSDYDINLTLNMFSGTGSTTLRITGAGQSIYFEGNGNLTVTNGTLALNDHPYFRPYNGRGLTVTKNGLVDVGAGKTTRFGGYSNGAKLIMREGGRMNFGADLQFGAQPAGGHSLIVDGAGSLCSGGNLYVDMTAYDNNTITITNGGELRLTGIILLGYASGADANTVIVTGSGSKLSGNAGYNYIGLNGNNNRITVEDSAYAYFDYLQISALDQPAHTNNALVVKSGASVVCGHDIVVHTNSVLELEGGSITSASPIEVKQTALLKGYGTIRGGVTMNGTLTAGSPTGVLTIAQADLTFGSGAAANFTFTSAGFEPGTYGVVQGTAAAGEDVTFNGTLNLTFNGDCRGRTAVKIFDFDSYAGNFSTVNVAGMSSATHVSFNPADGTVTLVPSGMLFMFR